MPDTFIKGTYRPLVAAVGTALLLVAAAPASADRTYWGGGAGQFQDAITQWGSNAWNGAQSTGSQAWSALRDNGSTLNAIRGGVQAVTGTARGLRLGSPYQLYVIPEGYGPSPLDRR